MNFNEALIFCHNLLHNFDLLYGEGSKQADALSTILVEIEDMYRIKYFSFYNKEIDIILSAIDYVVNNNDFFEYEQESIFDLKQFCLNEKKDKFKHDVILTKDECLCLKKLLRKYIKSNCVDVNQFELLNILLLIL